MDIRRLRTALWFTSGSLAGIGVLALALLLGLPYARAVTEDSHSVAPIADTSANGPTLPPREAFEPLCGLPLRRPLYDAAVVIEAAPVRAAAPLSIRLIGTIVEPGESLAIFLNREHRTEFVGVGDTVDGATVLTITDAGVTIRYDGQDKTLALDPEEDTARK